jgi:hypothetical protein
MSYDNNITPGNPPLVWSRIKDAFDKINQNFTIIGAQNARQIEKNIAHIESNTVDSNPVRIVTTTNHDYTNGQQVFVFDTGVYQIDNNEYYVSVSSTTEVFLYNDQALTNAVDGTAFDAYASGGGKIQGFSQFATIDFENLTTNVSPGEHATYGLGTSSKSWKKLYIAQTDDTDANLDNGVWLGTAQIKGKTGGIVDLPLGSTVGGSLIINPEQTFFKSVQVDSGNQVVADDFVDTLNLISGTAISMAVDSGAESITITNTGVTQLASGAGLSVNAATGNITVTNTGVISLTSTTALPAGRTEGAGINVSGSTGSGLKITNAGVIQVDAGTGITVFTDDATGIVTVTNSSPAQNTFGFIDVFGQTSIAADSPAGRLELVEGSGIQITTNASDDKVTFTFNGIADIKGSVFADDSTVLVDAIDAKIVGNVDNTSVTTTAVNTNNLTADGVIDFTNARIDFTNSQWQNIPDPIFMDIVGSVFADDSTKLIDAVEGEIYGTIKSDSWSLASDSYLTISNGGATGPGPIQIVASGDLDLSAGAGQTINANRNIIASGGVTGNLTGYQTGDMTGSVFADDSTKLVDAVEGKIVGPVESDNIRGTLIGTVYADDSTEIIDAEGTVLGTIAPGAAAPASETEAAPVGEIRVDDNYVYVRKSTGWGKIAIGGWV